MNLFQQVEQGFDKLFDYNRQQAESFYYLNTMKNNSITEQLKLQKQNLQSIKRKTGINQDSNPENLLSTNLENKETRKQSFNTRNNQTVAPLIFLLHLKLNHLQILVLMKH